MFPLVEMLGDSHVAEVGSWGHKKGDRYSPVESYLSPGPRPNVLPKFYQFYGTRGRRSAAGGAVDLLASRALLPARLPPLAVDADDRDGGDTVCAECRSNSAWQCGVSFARIQQWRAACFGLLCKDYKGQQLMSVVCD